MSLRPSSTKLLLVPAPRAPISAGGIALPNLERHPHDEVEWVVFACGSKVSYELKPGSRVIIDPRNMNQSQFEWMGTVFKVVEAKDVQLILGVPAE